MSRRRQRGFTLIELMVALLVSSLLVGMILAIFSRMSLAYRGQQQIAGVQQVLAAARATIELDAKQAGLEMSQGFKLFSDGPPAPAGQVHSPVSVINSSTGPDQIAFFYADTNTQAAVTGGTIPAGNTVTVDATTGFAASDVVVLVKVDAAVGITPPDTNTALIATYDACVLQVLSVNPSPPTPTITFSSAPPWSNGIFTHCTAPSTGMMLYKFVARAYRIDTTTAARAALGLLQQSQTGALFGGVFDNWNDLAFGFTDLQTALQIYDNDLTDTDGDGNTDREWYSGQTQQNLTATGVPPIAPIAVPLQMSISLVARTDRDVEGISTSQTPELTEVAVNPRPLPLPPWTRDNNPIGDRPSVNLPAAPPWLADPALQGARIYRYITFQVDFRNLGVGR
jgi:prepilin-type N-terminal cleavage/methylation domain-containing protein